jgi:RNA polymerase sigma-70 factor (ECF subfamily)
VTALVWLEARFGAARPKAIAVLNRVFRNLDVAEEAFAVACERAVARWPKEGPPDDPLAWLLVVGRNAGLDIVRREHRRARLIADIVTDEAAMSTNGELTEGALADDVLRLLFICCHPDLARQDQSALALRIVAGLDLERVAAAFLISSPAMEKRLTRAKRTIRDGAVGFEAPDHDERRARLKAVCLMLYLMFNEGWTSAPDTTGPNRLLCEEAIRLVRLVLSLSPAEAELQGLLALLLFHYARRDGRVEEDGRPLTLDEQRRDRWDRTMIREATAVLEKALRHLAPGPFQLQAAIAAEHARAVDAQATDWNAIERLYLALLAVEDTPVIRLNHAAAVARVAGAAPSLVLLDTLSDRLDGYLWFHTMRGALLAETGQAERAADAYRRALDLDPPASERRIIVEKLERLRKVRA